MGGPVGTSLGNKISSLTMSRDLEDGGYQKSRHGGGGILINKFDDHKKQNGSEAKLNGSPSSRFKMSNQLIELIEKQQRKIDESLSYREKETDRRFERLLHR